MLELLSLFKDYMQNNVLSNDLIKIINKFQNNFTMVINYLKKEREIILNKLKENENIIFDLKNCLKIKEDISIKKMEENIKINNKLKQKNNYILKINNYLINNTANFVKKNYQNIIKLKQENQIINEKNMLLENIIKTNEKCYEQFIIQDFSNSLNYNNFKITKKRKIEEISP